MGAGQFLCYDTATHTNSHKGWYSLAAAKTYYELHPECKLIVLEASASLGGVWSEDCINPRLKSNNILGTFEYSDFPVDTDTYWVEPGEHVPGSVIHRYFTDYAQHFGMYLLKITLCLEHGKC